MAETTTITRPSPIIEGSLTAFLKSIDKLGAGAVPANFAGIDPSRFAPTIAAESSLQQQARTAAGGLGSLTGPQAYQPYMSPYQQEVIDTTMTAYDQNAATRQTGLRDSAIQAGAYGGGREGVQRAMFDQQSIGQAGQMQQQAVLDAAATAEREQQYQPFTQLGLIGQQLAQIQPGAFPTQTVGYAPPAAATSPLQSAIGTAAGLGSIGSKLGLFG